MEIQVRDVSGELLWARSPVGGFTSQAYGADGTLQNIERALCEALEQCRGELLISVDRDRVSDVGRAPA